MEQRDDIVRLAIQEASRLPVNLWNDLRCQLETDELVRLLITPGMLELLAIHEAGHEIYYLRAGCRILGFESPRIIYSKQNENPFFQQRTRTLLGSQFQPQGDDWLLELARGYAAGGRCSIRLTTTDYAGDTIDRKLFNEMYISCHPDEIVDIRDIDKMWSDAQKDVNKDLDDECFQAQVRARAREIMPQLFPWLDAQHNRP